MYQKLLDKHIKHGILHLHLPEGKNYTFGEHGEEVHWHVASEKAMRRIAMDPEFQLGQTYMDGLWHPGESSLYQLLSVLRRNFNTNLKTSWFKPITGLLQQWNKITRSYSNVAHHYDIEEGVFRRFLDREMFYSCAYFESENDNLEQAQQNKARHIAGKLCLEPGNNVLDIGCGWGSMMFYLAQNHQVEVSGITLSKEQLAVARQEAEKRQLKNTRFYLEDYREHEGLYDRIVSIGMFEHVGVPFYKAFFKKMAALLKEDGVALLHTIGKTGTARPTNPWIHKYIFPGGVNPSLSQICKALEPSGLRLCDIEVLRLHYAKTLKHWNTRFQNHREEIAAILDERFCRMWEFYLLACAVTFEHSDLVVYQLQLTKKHGIVPITRDYLYNDPGTSK
ncbi:MAG: SAM-dependent methyltransferase [Gammaproteobacteria bacterium]|nr:SAM-dependent methyltransferase [Gammaproteobacteria bacterium]